MPEPQNDDVLKALQNRIVDLEKKVLESETQLKNKGSADTESVKRLEQLIADTKAEIAELRKEKKELKKKDDDRQETKEEDDDGLDILDITK